MATISTSIQLYDRVSAPINNMITALDNMCSAYENVEDSMNSGFNPAHIEATRQAINSAAQQMVGLGNNIEDNEQHQQNFNNAVNQGQSAMDGLIGKALSLAAAYMGIQTIKNALNLSDELTQTTARIGMMNDAFNKVNGTAMQTNDLVDLIYQSAQNARGSFSDMAAVVAKFGNNARDAFSSQREVVDFANLIQKQMTIAGASTSEASNAMLQLSQALGSGVLRGDELNSIFEQAPNLIQSIADYMDIPIGQIKQMAQEGKLSADIVKQAIFADADDINAKFEQMPITWGQVWTMMGNTATKIFRPILDKINELANNQQFQTFASNAVNALSIVVGMLVKIMEVAGMVGGFFVDNWSIIEPILIGIASALALINAPLAAQAALWVWNTALVPAYTAVMTFLSIGYGVLTGNTAAASAAQFVYNNALLACPLTWILLIIIAVIAALYAIVAAINKVTGSTTSATGIIMGVLTTALAFLWNLFLGLFNLILGIINGLINPFINIANFIGNVFTKPVSSVIYLFQSMADGVLATLEKIASAMDFVFGSNMADTVAGWRAGLKDMADAAVAEYAPNENYQKVMDNLDLNVESLGLKRWEYGDAWNSGYKFGEGIDKSVSDMFNPKALDTSNMFGGAGYQAGDYDAGKVANDIANTESNTGKAADSLDISSEDLKYLHDIAEREVINKFTTAEIKIEMTNHNNVNSDMDLDGIVDHLTSSVNEAMETAARG